MTDPDRVIEAWSVWVEVSEEAGWYRIADDLTSWDAATIVGMLKVPSRMVPTNATGRDVVHALLGQPR